MKRQAHSSEAYVFRIVWWRWERLRPLFNVFLLLVAVCVLVRYSDLYLVFETPFQRYVAVRAVCANGVYFLGPVAEIVLRRLGASFAAETLVLFTAGTLLSAGVVFFSVLFYLPLGV